MVFMCLVLLTNEKSSPYRGRHQKNNLLLTKKT